MMHKHQKIDSNAHKEAMVFVTHVDCMKTAEDYVETLGENGIPSTIENRGSGTADFGFGLFVPEQYYDEAHMLIQSRQTQNDFYDFFFDDTLLGDQADEFGSESYTDRD